MHLLSYEVACQKCNIRVAKRIWRNLALCPVCEQIERNKLKGGRNE